MPGIAAFANEARTALEQVVSAIEIPDLTKLVSLQTGYQTGFAFSPEWERMSSDERGKTGHEFRKAHVEHFKCHQKLTKTDGSSPTILQAYSPITIPLPLGDDETYEQLKERLEIFIASEAKYVNTNPMYSGSVNAYHIGEIQLEYRIPNDEAREIVACMPIAGNGFISRPASELLHPRWTFNLTYFNINSN